MGEEMFRIPLHRGIQELDKALFRKEAVVPAAIVRDFKKISGIRSAVNASNDILQLKRINSVVADQSGLKSILLKPHINAEDPKTWSPTIKKLVDEGDITLRSQIVSLGYDNWTTKEILHSILPEELHEDAPTSFNTAGHIAHLNLREQYLPFKSIIAQVIMSSSPNITTVINKTETLGSENEFRVLDYELLYGDPDLHTEVHRGSCTFKFDYGKVFWNSKLSTEHERLIGTFAAGDAVCDVMAGVGPFALPAGKRQIFVWANDLNPDCYRYLAKGIAANKVSQFVTAFNEDGHTFIKSAAQRLQASNHTANVPLKISTKEPKVAGKRRKDEFETVVRPKVFSHYVMNLPSTAMDFLPDFIGLYAGKEHLFTSPKLANGAKLPMIHCYCFAIDGEDGQLGVQKDICARISEKIGFPVRHDDEDLVIWDVRDVAPLKRQYCASFRLPAEVAFWKNN